MKCYLLLFLLLGCAVSTEKVNKEFVICFREPEVFSNTLYILKEFENSLVSECLEEFSVKTLLEIDTSKSIICPNVGRTDLLSPGMIVKFQECVLSASGSRMNKLDSIALELVKRSIEMKRERSVNLKILMDLDNRDLKYLPLRYSVLVYLYSFG